MHSTSGMDSSHWIRPSDGATALHRAAERANSSVVTRLLAARAAVNAVDHEGATALHRAAAVSTDNGDNGDVVKVVKQLLKPGVFLSFHVLLLMDFCFCFCMCSWTTWQVVPKPESKRVVPNAYKDVSLTYPSKKGIEGHVRECRFCRCRFVHLRMTHHDLNLNSCKARVTGDRKSLDLMHPASSDY